MRSSLCSFLGGALSRKRRAAENEVPEQTEQGTCGEDDGEARLLAIGGKDVEKFPHRETGVADTVLMMVWRLVKRARICSGTVLALARWGMTTLRARLEELNNPTPIRELSTSFCASPALFAEAVQEGYFPAAAGIDSELEEVVHGIHDVLQYSAMADTRS